MVAPPPARRRGRILFSLLLLLFGVGVVPLVATSILLVSKSREILELDQKAVAAHRGRQWVERLHRVELALGEKAFAKRRHAEIDELDKVAAAETAGGVVGGRGAGHGGQGPFRSDRRYPCAWKPYRVSTCFPVPK